MDRSLKQTPLTCSGHTRPVVHLAYSNISEFGYFLISACKDGKPMLRQGDTGDWIGTFEGHKGAVWGATLSRDGLTAATGAADYSAKVWDAVTGDEKHSFTHKHIVKSVDFTPDKTCLLTGSNEKILRIFNLGAPDAEPLMFTGHKSGIRGTIFVDNGKRIVSISDDKTIRLWDCSTQEEVKKIELPSAPGDVELSHCGSVLTIPYGQKVSFWDAEKMEKIKEFDMPNQINSASLHPDKHVVVGGGEDFKMYKYDYGTGLEMEWSSGHFGPIHCVRFSPDGEAYASGSEDGTLRLWQTTVGKTYGLWKCAHPEDQSTNNETSPPVIKAEA